MKKIILFRGQSNAIAIALLFLTLLTVLTAPQALSRFRTTGAGAAEVRIAKWDPIFEVTDVSWGDTIIVTDANTSAAPAFACKAVVTNAGEVTAWAEPHVYSGVYDEHAASGVDPWTWTWVNDDFIIKPTVYASALDANGGVALPPGGVETFTYEIAYDAAKAGEVHKYICLRFDAVQVD